MFEPDQRSYNKGAMEYDGIVDGRKILSHFDGDIARLIRFREAQNYQTEPADVICFPWQAGFLKSYLNGLAGLRELNMDAVEAALAHGVFTPSSFQAVIQLLIINSCSLSPPETRRALAFCMPNS